MNLKSGCVVVGMVVWKTIGDEEVEVVGKKTDDRDWLGVWEKVFGKKNVDGDRAWLGREIWVGGGERFLLLSI